MNVRSNDIIISGNNLNLTDALKSVVQQKMGKLFEHEGHIIRVRVELTYSANGRRGKEYRAQGYIEIRGKDMVVTVESDDLYGAIDQLELRLDRMLRRRSRLFRLKRKHTHEVDIPASLPKVEVA